MKFLCVPCDQPMKLMVVKPPDRGSLSVVYGCVSCGYEMAMLTNAHETQLVTSLGVRIGPEEAASGAGGQAAAGSASKGCPFSAMIPGYGERSEDSTGATESVGAPDVRWTDTAAARLEAIPSFVRPMARAGIEKFAAERGLSEVTEKVLDEARDHFGM